jgi:hypothetical protein
MMMMMMTNLLRLLLVRDELAMEGANPNSLIESSSTLLLPPCTLSSRCGSRGGEERRRQIPSDHDPAQMSIIACEGVLVVARGMTRRVTRHLSASTDGPLLGSPATPGWTLFPPARLHAAPGHFLCVMPFTCASKGLASGG